MNERGFYVYGSFIVHFTAEVLLIPNPENLFQIGNRKCAKIFKPHSDDISGSLIGQPAFSENIRQRPNAAQF
jgi:hypothetical protein